MTADELLKALAELIEAAQELKQMPSNESLKGYIADGLQHTLGALGVPAAPAPDQYGTALATMPKTPDEVAWLKPCALGACPQPEVCGKRGSCAERGGQQ